MSLLVKPEPFSQEFDRFFSRLFDNAAAGGATSAQRWVPPMDLLEADDHFVLRADLPGMAEDDVSIEVQDGTLTISGERATEHEHQERGWFRVERSFGRFNRSLSLPDGVDADGVSAEFERGVLTVRIPKPEQRKPRRIEIHAANGDARREERETIEGTATESPDSQS
jgi:HSP20 family protein